MIKKYFFSFVIFLLVALMSSSFLYLLPVQAAGATLFISPASGNYKVGATVSAKLLVNSGGGSGINAVEASVNFDPSILKIKSISNSSSIFKLWTNDPTSGSIALYNKSGSIPLGGGSPTAYTGSSGNIISVSFTVLKAGNASVSISNGVVLAADGQGTNIFSGSSAAQFVTQEAAKEPAPVPVTTAPKEEVKTPEAVEKQPEPAKEKTSKGALPPIPEVNSLTHPDENKWYADNNPEFSWKLLLDITGVGMAINDNATFDPAETAGGIVESKKFEKVPDGTHYFHIKFKNTNGWGPVTHRKLLVDSTAPKSFDLKVLNNGDVTNPTPTLIFDTKDVTSGINKMEMILDGETSETPYRDFGSDPYKTKVLKPGEHQVTVAAYDMAGNTASSTKKFLVEALKSPIITEIPSLISNKDKLSIRGTSFYTQVNIEISISRSKKEIETFRVRTDNEGNWAFFAEKPMSKGNLEIWAKVIDDRGAESYDSARRYLTVVSPSIIESYGLYIIIFLALMIIVLTAYIWFTRRKINEQKNRIKREVAEAKKKTIEIFAALVEEVGELMEYADKKAGMSESERRVKDKIEEALSISEEFISKEIEDVEKEVK